MNEVKQACVTMIQFLIKQKSDKFTCTIGIGELKFDVEFKFKMHEVTNERIDKL